MQAWVITEHGGPENLKLVEWPRPEPAAGQVLVRVRAVSLNYRDLGTLRHQRPGNLEPPLIPCSDFAGEVTAVGSGCTVYHEGDRVVGNFFREWIDGPFDIRYHEACGGGSLQGALCQYVAVPEYALLPAPSHLSLSEAATLPVAAVTAWQALFTRGQLQPGATVLTLGTGGVSIFALQLATAAGARVIVTSSSDEKLARARQLGAWETVNYRTHPDWDQEVWRITEKQGARHVIELGGSGTLEKSMNSVAAGGQIALIGVLTGFGAPSGGLFPLMVRNARIDGIYVGSRTEFQTMNEFLEEHNIHPVIDRSFGFDVADRAFELMASARHFGKIVIKW